MSRLRRILPVLRSRAIFFVALAGALFLAPHVALAAANTGISATSVVTVGDTVSVVITVNTNGQSANAFQGTLSYPTDIFDGVRGTYSGSICTLPIVQPDPSNGSAQYSCGKPSGFSGSGTVATVVLTAKASGSATFALSGCQVLANDGQGTDITGSCGSRSITVNPGSVATSTPTLTPVITTPTPTSAATPTPANNNNNNNSNNSSTATKTATPKASTSPKASPSPTLTPTPDTRTPVPAEQANQPSQTPTPAAPAVQALGSPTPVPSGGATGTTTSLQNRAKRSVSQAIQDLLGSVKQIPQMAGNLTGIIALMVALIPFLALLFGILFLGYRLLRLERRRRSTMDRLFEMELSELAALEGKLDLLSTKGNQGRDQYRNEFKKAKENILRQLKPDYGHMPKEETKPETGSEPAPEKPEKEPDKKK